MSDYFMIYIDENTNFNPSLTKKAISSMDNADLAILKSEHSEGFVKYKFGEREININIGKDWRFIAVEHTGDAGLYFAIQLNKLLNESLFLTDSSYGFVCQLDEVNSIENINEIIEQGIYMNE